METPMDSSAPEGSGRGSKRQRSPAQSEAEVGPGALVKYQRLLESEASTAKARDSVRPPGPHSEEEGNPQHRLMLKLHGYLGHKIDLSDRYKKVTYIDLNVENLRKALADLMMSDLYYRMSRKRLRPLTDVVTFLTTGVTIIVNTTMKAIYARLRALHLKLQEKKSRYTDRPSFPSEAELPAPIASLVQGLGQIRIMDYTDDMLVAPTYPEGVTYEGATDGSWTYISYMGVVEELKSYGIPFKPVVMKDTQGGSWWLYRDRITENRHELAMPFPVSNFSEHSAVLRGLLLCNSSAINEHQIAGLDDFDYCYGTMLREVGIGDNVLYFRALIHEDESEWRPSHD